MRAYLKHIPFVSGLLLSLGLVFGLPRAPAPAVDGQPLLEAGFGGIGSSSAPKFSGGSVTSQINMGEAVKIAWPNGGFIESQTAGSLMVLNLPANGLSFNGGIMSLSSATGFQALTGSAHAWVRQTQTGIGDARLIGITSAAGQVASRMGSSATDASGADASDLWALCTDCSATTPVTKWRATGKGAMQSLGLTSASNNLAGALVCNSTNVGTEVWYSDTSTTKISKCACEQTGAGTFAWGAVTSTGDCT